MTLYRLFRRAGVLWFNAESDQHAAAMAYFICFSITPLLLISITMVGLMIGTERIADLLRDWGNTIDPEITVLLDSSVDKFNMLTTEFDIPVLGILFFSAMIIVALNSLTSGLHKMFGVTGFTWYGFFERAARAVVFVLVFQMYLVALIVLGGLFAQLAITTGFAFWTVLSSVGFLAITIILFTVAYGLLPLSAPSFGSRLYGAIVAALLFLTTREIVAFHIATAPVPSIFGAAGIIVVLLVWVYVAACIVLFGGAFAAAHSEYKSNRT
jgi:membrane protein